MSKYSLGKIYRIYSDSAGLQYIGSTCEPTIANRIAAHRYGYKLYKKGSQKYISSYDILEYDDYQYELLETYPCNSRDELRSREGYWIRKGKEDGNCSNKLIAGRTKKEYTKEYYEDNKEILIEKSRQHYVENKEAVDEYKNGWYEKNKDRILEKRKEYREVNKDAIREQKKQKVTCECGSVTLKCTMARHKRTKKHLSAIANSK